MTNNPTADEVPHFDKTGKNRQNAKVRTEPSPKLVKLQVIVPDVSDGVTRHFKDAVFEATPEIAAILEGNKQVRRV